MYITFIIDKPGILDLSVMKINIITCVSKYWKKIPTEH
jgi:hypothetical protein